VEGLLGRFNVNEEEEEEEEDDDEDDDQMTENGSCIPSSR
jgi:hypothetical protein